MNEKLKVVFDLRLKRNFFHCGTLKKNVFFSNEII